MMAVLEWGFRDGKHLVKGGERGEEKESMESMECNRGDVVDTPCPKRQLYPLIGMQPIHR